MWGNVGKYGKNVETNFKWIRYAALCWQASDLGSFPFSQNFRFEISETFRVKWKGFSHAGEGPRFQFQTCNVNTDGARSQQNGR